MIVDTCPTCDQIVDEEDILKSTQNLFGSACIDCGDNFNSIHNGNYEVVTLVIQREEDLSVSVRCNDCHMRNMMKQGISNMQDFICDDCEKQFYAPHEGEFVDWEEEKVRCIDCDLKDRGII